MGVNTRTLPILPAAKCGFVQFVEEMAENGHWCEPPVLISGVVT